VRIYKLSPQSTLRVVGQFDMRRFVDATRGTSRPGFQPLGCGSICTRALPWAGIGARRWRLRPSAGCGSLGSVTTSASSQTDPLPRRCNPWIGIGRAFSPWAVALSAHLHPGHSTPRSQKRSVGWNALGWYRSAPLALETIARCGFFGERHNFGFFSN